MSFSSPLSPDSNKMLLIQSRRILNACGTLEFDRATEMIELASVTHSEQFSGRKVRPMQGQSVLELLEGKVTNPYAGANHVGYEIFGLKAYFVGDW